MASQLPLLFALMISGVTVFLFWIILRAYRIVLRRNGHPSNIIKKRTNYLGIGLIVWLFGVALIAKSGYLRDFTALPPRFLIVLLPTIITILILSFSKRFYHTVLKLLPAKYLVYIQSYRIVVELALFVGFLAGMVPFQMTLEGFNYDIIVGITALFAGFVFFRKRAFSKFNIILWNVFGLILVLNILIISILSTPAPFQVFFNEPANTMVVEFPFIWLPGIIVPFAILTHILSIKQAVLMDKEELIGMNN